MHHSTLTVSRAVTHPLTPLTADEVRSTREILDSAGELTPSTRFVFVTLKEPPKQTVIAWDGLTPMDREADVVLYDRAASTTIEAIVSLTQGSVVSTERLRDVQPPLMFEEFMAAEDLLKSDPLWQEAVRKRGVTDISLAMVDPWPSGWTSPDDDPGRRRIIRPLTFIRREPGEHGYARPVEGLICTIDLDSMTVVDVEDHGVVPLPTQPGNYEPRFMFDPENRPAYPRLRDDVKPIEITQPEGPSFTLDGNLLEWQKWSLVVGFTPREGLVLHDIQYRDRDIDRRVIYRASLSEMFIPYGDPAPTHWRKNVFDEGEVGLGVMVNQLTLGCDCLGDITYLDAVLNDQDGEPYVLKNAICIHEEDAGIAWKHTDFRTEIGEVRRLRKLVISCIATVGNYEYGYYWYLYQDGSIEYEVKLSGVLSTGAAPVGSTPKHGTMVAPGLYGPNHQHFFCVRLDMAVDGVDNSVYEVNSKPLPPGPENPYLTAWVAEPTLLARESEAARSIDLSTARYWRVVNPNRMNELGQPVGYKLEAGGNAMPMFQEGSVQARRGGFAKHHLWVTAYEPTELFAAGNYVAQNPGPDGLPVYQQADRPLDNTDVVLWYVFCAHHVARPEDWPVMPVTRVGFHLKPSGFFDGNPALDLPQPTSGHCAHHNGNGTSHGKEA